MASEKITKFIEDIKALTVLELNELVKAIEEIGRASWLERGLVGGCI